jgi:uncharacterized protein
MKPKKKLQQMYSKIPTFQCREGCTDCCGPVPFSKTEWDSISDKRKAETGTLACPYSLSGGCDIYKDRPFICRLFGTAKNPTLTCPHGCGPKHKMSSEKADALTESYRKIMNK